MRVYLTGFMASGKSSLGRNVAMELGFEFIDLDAAIEAEAGKTVGEIFREDGEPAFRAAEAAALRATSDLDNHVIAVGGGTLVPDANMDWALEHGTVVFLDLPAEELVRRLSRSRTTPTARGSHASESRRVGAPRRGAARGKEICLRKGATYLPTGEDYGVKERSASCSASAAASENGG